jgi:hypothetical protein
MKGNVRPMGRVYKSYLISGGFQGIQDRMVPGKGNQHILPDIP